MKSVVERKDMENGSDCRGKSLRVIKHVGDRELERTAVMRQIGKRRKVERSVNE